jgi:hypothetical protein
MKFKLSFNKKQNSKTDNKVSTPKTPLSKKIDFCLNLESFQEEEEQIRNYCLNCIKAIEEKQYQEAFLLLNNREIDLENNSTGLLNRLKKFVATQHYTIIIENGKMTAKAEIWDYCHTENVENGIFVGRGDLYSLDKTKFNVLPYTIEE